MNARTIAAGIIAMLTVFIMLVTAAVMLEPTEAKAGHSPQNSCWGGAGIPYLSNRGDVVRSSASMTCHSGVNAAAVPYEAETVKKITIKAGLWMRKVDGTWVVRDGANLTCLASGIALDQLGGTCRVHFEVPCEGGHGGNPWRWWRTRVSFAEAEEYDGEIHRLDPGNGYSEFLACFNNGA